MAREFLLPELAESVVEGEILKWLVAEGETVSENQPIVEVMTDKVTVELPSPFSGVLEKHLVSEGDVVAVQTPIARFADEAQALSENPPEKEAPLANQDEAPDESESLSFFQASEADEEITISVTKNTAGDAGLPDKIGPYERILAVPAARKLARELDIPLENIKGSGPNGRIRVEDVRSHSAKSTKPALPEYQINYVTPEGYATQEERLPMRGLRRVIAQQMVASHLQSVRTLHVDEVDVTELVALRKKLKPLAEKRGVKLSYMPFIVKAVLVALRKYPILNSSFDEKAQEIVLKHYYNIGIAVATENGLVVPVINGVENRGILDIAKKLTILVEKARSNKLDPKDIQHSTFSITNIGSLGGLFSFPIVNVPEAAILGIHTIKKRPVVVEEDGEDKIIARQMLYLSLSFDHRIIDGAEAALFTNYLIELLEVPESLMLEH